MTTPKQPQQPDVYAHTFDIPAEQWSATDTLQTESIRARRRAWIRRMAKAEWRLAKKTKQAWKVERFVALIGVAYPRMNDVVPSRAAETVKPIIDGGTDARLWPDDDAYHRCSTIYFQMPEPAPRDHYQLHVFIFPVPDRNPAYQIATAMSIAIRGEWERQPEKTEGWQGYNLRFTVPHRLWISSNLTDSDLAARQHGARKATRWGGWQTFGTREKVTRQLEAHITPQWDRQAWWPVDRFFILAGVSYPIGVGKDEADPDNVAETVNAILNTGSITGAWAGVGAKRCKGVGFYRWPVDCPGGRHELHISVLPLPPGAQIGDAVADSYEQAWAEWSRRLTR